MLVFITKTSIKVLAYNILFLINKLMGNDENIDKIKRLVSVKIYKIRIFIRYCFLLKIIYFICNIV